MRPAALMKPMTPDSKGRQIYKELYEEFKKEQIKKKNWLSRLVSQDYRYERHESRRIDNQLRGRSGRQVTRGKPFYISLEDDLSAFSDLGVWNEW